jgi:hypothetical protein
LSCYVLGCDWREKKYSAMKKFLACNANKRVWSENSMSHNDEHLIIYCKNLSTIFKAWSDQQVNVNVKKITINNFTDDPSLSINPYTMPNLSVCPHVREIHFNCYTHDYWLSLVLSLCPNVEVLHFFKLTKGKLRYLLEHLEYLTHVTCEYMEDDLINYYEELIKSDKSLNCNVKIN